MFQVPAGQQTATAAPPQGATAPPGRPAPQAVGPALDVLVGDPRDGLHLPRPAGARSHSRTMTEGDRMLLGMGILVALVALVCAFLLFAVLRNTGAGPVSLVLLLGIGGVVLMAFALRRQALVACGVVGSILALLVLSIILSAKVGAGRVPETPERRPPTERRSPTQADEAQRSGAPSVPSSDSKRTVAQRDATRPAPTQSASPDVAFNPMPVAGFTKTQLIGGHRIGSPYEEKILDQPITCVIYQPKTWAGQSGIDEIRPSKVKPTRGERPAVVAKDGYAVGGIQTDSGSDSMHAFQLVFMRIRPDGHLDPDDSYTSDWIGEPVGPIQKLTTSGERVVGFYGQRGVLIYSVGLVLASDTPTVASSAPPDAKLPLSSPLPKRSQGSSRSKDRSPFARKDPQVKKQPPSKKATSPPPAAESQSSSASVAAAPLLPLPKVVQDALDSTLLVEHPLASGSGFVVGKRIVATNAHVVEGAFPDEIKIRHGDENTAPSRISRILHYDRARDLCLLEAETELKSLPVRSDYVLQPGDSVVLMGNPSVKGGILMRNVTSQGRLRTLVHIEGQDLYHIDANVNPGWSGGPVLDFNANVIAIVVMKANEDAVKDIRDAMQKLDDSFRGTGAGSAQGGIAYGIPGSALARVLADAKLKDPERQAATNDKYVAQTLVGRMRFLASLALLRMRINVPLQVRYEANAMAQGQFVGRPRPPGVRVDYVPLVPEEIAQALRALLTSDEIKDMELHFRKDMDSRIRAIGDSPHVAEEVKHDVKTLKTKIKEAETYAEKPATTYVGYSVKVSGFAREIKQIVQRAEQAVDK